jgi:SAM-dependent methyltransferase
MESSRSTAQATAIQLAEDPQELVVCPMCGSDEPEVLFYARDRLFARPGKYRVVRCSRCQLRYLSPRPTLAALSLHYPPDYFIYQKPEELNRVARLWAGNLAWQRWNDCIGRVERVRGAFAPDTRIIDVGCGLNDHLFVLQSLRGCQGLGIDFSPEIAAYVRDQRKMPVFEGTLHDAKFPNGEFDVVTMYEYLEHEPFPLEALTEARRVTKRGGHLTVEVPFFDSWPARLFGSRWSQVDAPRHLIQFTRATLTDMLRRAGWELIGTETFLLPGLIGASVLQALGHRRLGRLTAFDRSLIGLAALPFLPFFPFLDELLFAIARAV